ncbi:MAG: hypothetical protein U0531_03535 [Dehalococcoidia bacterium]
MLLKSEILAMLSDMSDIVAIDEIMQRLYVMQKISQGEAALERGNILSLDDVDGEIARWQASSGPARH